MFTKDATDLRLELHESNLCRSISMLSFRLCLGLHVVSCLLAKLPQFYTNFSLSTYVLSHYWFYRHNIFLEQYKLWSSSLCKFLHYSLTSRLLDQNIFSSTCFSNTLNLFHFFKVRNFLWPCENPFKDDFIAKRGVELWATKRNLRISIQGRFICYFNANNSACFKKTVIRLKQKNVMTYRYGCLW